jgi:hypothetical protein
MKFLSILAAASLALAPAFASAGSSTETTESADNGRPISGPLAGRVLDGSPVPMGAVVVGGLVIIGGAIILILSGGDSNNNTND